MAVTQTQIRRGTSTEVRAMTPASSEVVHDTTNKRLHVGDGSTAAGIILPNRVDILNNALTYKAAGGTANAITVTLDEAAAAYTTGMIVRFKAGATNTAATTINVSGLGTKNIYKSSAGSIGALVGGEIVSGGMYEVAYDGTQFQLLGIAPAETSSSGWELLSIATASASSTLDFTGLDGTYENYAFVLSGLVFSASANLWLRTDEENGASFDSGASDYSWAKTNIAVATETHTNDDSDAQIVIGEPATTSSVGWSGIVYMLHRVAARWQTFDFDGSICSATGTSWVRTCGKGQRKSATGNPQNAVRFMPSTGNFASGKIFCYGLRSAL
jgi:hypothetical protein